MTDTDISTETYRKPVELSDPTLQILRAWLEGLPGLEDVTVREEENGWGLYLMLDLYDPHYFESLSEIEAVVSTPARTLYDRSDGRKCLIEETVIGNEAEYEPSYELWVEGLDPSEVFNSRMREALLRELRTSTPREGATRSHSGASDHVADTLRGTSPCEENSDQKEGAR